MNFNPRIIEIKNTTEAERELAQINCDPMGAKIMSSKSVFRIIKLENVTAKAANLLKQTFLAKGGEAAIARGCADLSIDQTNVLICATLKQYKLALNQLKLQPWGLPVLANEIEKILTIDNTDVQREYKWSNCKLSLIPGRTIIMGILNVTPDSFSDGGKFNTIEKSLQRVEQMIAEGVDIIDIGAESTRPYGNSRKISAAEEIERLMPILERILSVGSIPISIDTYKASVAEAALRAGAHIINDIWGLQADADMAAVIAKYRVPVVVMHNNNNSEYNEDVMSHILTFLQNSIKIGLKAGIDQQNFIVDPGIGFGKTAIQNLQIMTKLYQLKALGCPILLGSSRKRFLGQVMDLDVSERVEGTAATVTIGIQQGVNIIRVHDVKQMVRVARTTEAILRGDYND